MADGERRDARLPAIRLTLAERADLEAKAAASGLDLSDYVRQHLTALPVKRKHRPVEGALLTELNRIGVNINQIARAVNRGRDHEALHLPHVLQHLVTVLEKLDRHYDS